jgi:cell division protein FtsB
MAKKQFQQSSSSRISSKRLLGTVLSLVIFFLLMTSVIGLGQKYFALKARSKDLADQQAALQQKNAALVASNDYLATPEGTEQSLRERYNYVKPGEGMIIVSPPPPPPPAPPAPTGIAYLWDQLLRGLGLRRD